VGFVKKLRLIFRVLMLCVSAEQRSHKLPYNGGQWSSDGYSCNKAVSLCVGEKRGGCLRL